MVATKCPNCGHIMTCGCQKKIAIDGTKCCKFCVDEVNRKFQKEKTQISPKRKTFLP